MPKLRGQALFAEAPSFGDFEKSASSRLSRDSKNWPEEVMDVLHQTQPYLADYHINVRMNKTDSDSGHGVGAINIDDKVIIPVVISDCRLAPLDVFISKEDVLPLTRPALEEALQRDDPIGEPVKPGRSGESSDASIAYLTLPPFDGKYAYASLSYADDQVKQAMAYLKPNQLEWGLTTSRAFEDVLRKYAANATEPVVEDTRAAAAVVDVEVNPAQLIQEPGIYKVATADGERAGFVAHNVYYFDLDDLREGVQAFVGLDKTAAFTDRPLWGSAYDGVPELEEDDWSGTGVFVFVKSADTIVTEPVNIRGSAGNDYIAELRGDKSIKFRKTASEQPFQRVEGDVDTILLNDDWIFLKLADKAQPVDYQPTTSDVPAAQTITKVGGYARMPDGETVRLRELADYLGRTYEDAFAKEAASRLMADGVVSYVELPAPEVKPIEGMPVLSNEEKAALWKTAALVEQAIYQAERQQLIKCAESAEELSRRTVDAVLSLNFLNEQNVLKFVESLDTMRDARRAVAQLLIAARVGLEVDSSPIRTALFALDAVIRDLTELKNITYSG